MLKRKKKIIVRNYKQLCVPYNIWSAGLKLFHFFKTIKIVYRYISFSNLVNCKIILKSEVLGVNWYPKTILEKLPKHVSA